MRRRGEGGGERQEPGGQEAGSAAGRTGLAWGGHPPAAPKLWVPSPDSSCPVCLKPQCQGHLLQAAFLDFPLPDRRAPALYCAAASAPIPCTCLIHPLVWSHPAPPGRAGVLPTSYRPQVLHRHLQQVRTGELGQRCPPGTEAAQAPPPQEAGPLPLAGTWEDLGELET